MHEKGGLLRSKRRALGKTQQEIADSIDVERSTYAKIEAGQTPRVHTAKKLALLYKMDWIELYKNGGIKGNGKNA